MTLDDFVAVNVYYDEAQRDVYKQILAEVGISDIVELKVWRDDAKLDQECKLSLAQQVAIAVHEKPSVILGQMHYLSAFCYNDGKTDMVIFDSHNDSWGRSNNFNNGSFINWRAGKTYVVGSDFTYTENDRLKIFSPREADEILKERISDNVFLSLDIDVFSRTTTWAHHWVEERGSFSSLSPEQVATLSGKIIKNRKLLGVNIAEYDPNLELPPYKTAKIITDYLKVVMGII